MKKLVLCLAVVAALAASAASADAQKKSHARNNQIRDGFWFSGGLGYGSLGCDNCGGSREGSMTADLSLGGTISPRFLVGAGTSAWSKTQQGTRLTVATLDARVRFYPSTTGGFFVTGGLGVGSMRGDVGGISATETGVGTILGLGWDYRVARNTSITPYWNGFAMKKGDVNANVGQAGIAVTLH